MRSSWRARTTRLRCLARCSRKLRSAARHAGVTWARQVAMYVVRRATGKPLMEIGRYFGGRDHTTVIHALAKVERRMEDDPTTRREIERWVKEAK